nr:reverse transcriptase [Tanacetum cinerariifolium]
YNKSTEEHYQHLQHVFKILATHHFHAKLSKCTFAATTIQYLGHVISSHGVAADPEKIEAIKSWPIPTNFTTLRGFLGLTGYYRRFVRNYDHTTAALTDLLRKSTFEWSKAALDSFNNLKTAMTSLVVLTLPNFTAPFEVTTDASNIAIGAVLLQKDRPIAFFSKKMCPRMQAASAYVRALFAITEAVKKWRQYLFGRRFLIFTDQRSLKHLLTQVVQTPEQYTWATKLLGFDFEIIYKPGRDNKVADALSRIPDATLFAISVTDPAWLSDLHAFYTSAAGQKLITKLTTSETANNQIVLRDGLLYADNRLYIPNGSPIRSKLLEEYIHQP